MRVSIILATYNERENICALIGAVRGRLAGSGLEAEVIVVDDNSPDGTAAAVKERCGGNPGVKLIVRTAERGLATAIRTGFAQAAGDVLVSMDADFSHAPDDVARLVEEAAHSDLVSGSRYLRGGGFEEPTIYRLYSVLINLFLRFVLGLRTTDNTNGFIALRRSLWEKLDLDRVFYGYGDFHFRLMYYAAKAGAVIREVPVVYKPRVHGRTKTQVFKHGWGYVVSALRVRFGRNG